MTAPWIGCRVEHCPARGHVDWVHFEVDEETWTCYHHARTDGPRMVANGWARVNEAEWLEEPSKLVDA